MIAVEDVSKSYGHVVALDRIRFHVDLGEVVALVGDNGAGKSTLLKILCGVLHRDSGTVQIDGRHVPMASPSEAAGYGISVVFQDLALVDTRSIAANIFLGREPGRIFVDRSRMIREAEDVLARLNVDIRSARTVVGQLSGGQRQSVAIARAIRQGGRLVILDEPTAALGIEGQRRVLDLIATLSEAGSSVILVSHNLSHVFEVAQRIVVLRAGRVAGVVDRNDFDSGSVVRLVMGGARR